MLQKQINEKYQQIHEFIDLLKKTDYHVIKHADPSSALYEIPQSIVAARVHARLEINRLESEIEQLETELEEMTQITDEIIK